MYLLDTNIWLERLLDQENSDEVGLFLSRIPSKSLLISDFSLHSIGVILSKFKKFEVFIDFVEDVFIEGGVNVVSVPPASMQRVVDSINRFNLDFDDAYQYVAAEIAEAVIVSFDKDFNKTMKKAHSPSDILSEGPG